MIMIFKYTYIEFFNVVYGKLLRCIFILFFIFFAALIVTPCMVSANALDTYGFGSRGPGMGNAYCAIAEGFSAVYYNPAGLSKIKSIDMGVGFLYTENNFDPLKNIVLGVDPDNPGEVLTGDIRFDNNNSTGMWGGVGASITKKLSVGFGIFLPDSQYLASLKSQSQREPHYLNFENRPRRLSLLSGISLKLFENLAIGAGANILFGPEGQIDFTLNSQAESSVDLSLLFRPRISPIFGILYNPDPAFGLGLTYHGEIDHGDLDLNVDGQMDMGILNMPVLVQVSSIIFHAPQRISAGIAYMPTDSLTLAMELSWENWASFNDASLDVNFHAGPGTIGSIDLPEPKLLFEKIFSPDFNDTVVFKIGSEYRLCRFCPVQSLGELDLSLRAGYTFEPTPIPDQKGLTNFLGSDRHIVALGMGFYAIDPFKTGKAIRIDLLLQWHILEKRKITKTSPYYDIDGDGIEETPVIGYPGYEVSGNALACGLTIGLDF